MKFRMILGLKPTFILDGFRAALKRRSSTVLHGICAGLRISVQGVSGFGEGQRTGVSALHRRGCGRVMIRAQNLHPFDFLLGFARGFGRTG